MYMGHLYVEFVCKYLCADYIYVLRSRYFIDIHPVTQAQWETYLASGGKVPCSATQISATLLTHLEKQSGWSSH
eukprot:COSAG03_NODE_2871_length_2389_cov_754.324759_2_plen_74_part_00